MKEIPPSAATAGMVLGRDILDDAGRTILSAGTVLSQTHCRMLSRREVAALMVLESQAEANQQEVRAMTAEAQTEAADPKAAERVAVVERMFADVADDPLMRELYRLALARAQKGGLRA